MIKQEMVFTWLFGARSQITIRPNKIEENMSTKVELVTWVNLKGLFIGSRIQIDYLTYF